MSKMSRISPTPWSAERADGEDDEVCYEIRDSHGETIAALLGSFGPVDPETLKAHAELLAAAPCLAEVLLGIYRDTMKAHGRDHDSPEWCWEKKQLDKMSDALRKAGYDVE